MPRSFSSYLAQSEKEAVESLMNALDWNNQKSAASAANATILIQHMRDPEHKPAQLESFMQDYKLDTNEGRALMTLAEALLRIPDQKTAMALIKDKVAAANWLNNVGTSKDWVAKAAGLGLFMTNKTLDSVMSRVGEPFMHQAMVKAMQSIGKQFVIGQDIEDAHLNAQKLYKDSGYAFSFDMLGEGARTAIDAEKYFEKYSNAIHYIGQRKNRDAQYHNGISVKLSALHPRFEYAQEERCIPEISTKLLDLAKLCANYNISLTIDAEETWRLNTTVQILENIIGIPSLKGWNGLGLAVQAYHKAAPALIEHIANRARETNARLRIRLVKGAYWDTEIKAAQIAGLDQFPVFTRKSHTDLSYMACAKQMLAFSNDIYPMFATHNAYTLSSIQELVNEYTSASVHKPTYEFQKLYGMGDSLYSIFKKQHPDIPVNIYAPVGTHKELLPYLVRRLLENGANSSFVNQVLDENEPISNLVSDPVDKVKNRKRFNHPKINRPADIFAAEKPLPRRNSVGLDLHAPEVIYTLSRRISALSIPYEIAPLIDGKRHGDKIASNIVNPANKAHVLGTVATATDANIEQAFKIARDAFDEWNNESIETRAKALERAADLYELHRAELIALLIREAGKTFPDAHAEVREAVDFLRYYANQGRELFASENALLPGPTGETNILKMQGRGTFICISPWNFPLAIFTGQIAAAVMAGNCVLAKPAEQTPIIATRAVQLMIRAHIPSRVLHLITGDGFTGEKLVNHSDTAGVAFTGSVQVAHQINRNLAEKESGIVPLIAETGGQNAMIADSSALPEQVVDDAIKSAFGSAGQRCSALRILLVQKDNSDTIINMLAGAIEQLHLGDPCMIASDIGPLIDEEAYATLASHRQSLHGMGKLIAEAALPLELENIGYFFPPSAWELPNLYGLEKEVFGPVLHVIRYEAEELDEMLDHLNSFGYGLTLGIHSRIKSFQEHVASKMQVGNVYINRAMTGAIVGSQPFGGLGLSGTGPKAGGPHYLQRFATEKVISENTTASGGNASLVSLGE